MRSERSPAFWGFLVAQGTTLLADAFLRQAVLFLAVHRFFPHRDLQGLAFAVSTAPVVLASGWAGEASERFGKTGLLRRVKEADVLLAGIAFVAFGRGSFGLCLALLALLGAKSALYSPVKYGAVAELVEGERLGRASGLVAMSTFLAITLGQGAAGLALDTFGAGLGWPTIGCALLGILGWGATRSMPRLPATAPSSSFSTWPWGSWETLGRPVWGDGSLRVVVLLLASFWLYTGVLQQCVNALGSAELLALRADQTSLLSALLVNLAVSIMFGSLIAGSLLDRLAARPLACFGAVMVGLGQALLLLAASAATSRYLLLHLVLAHLGFFGAFILVPLQTFLQQRTAPGQRGRVWAASGFLNAWALLGSGLLYQGARLLAVSPLLLLSGLGAMLALGTLVMSRQAFAPRVSE